MKRLFELRRLLVLAVLLLATTAQAGNEDSNVFARFKELAAPADTIKVEQVDISKMSQEEYEQYLLTMPVDTTREHIVNEAFGIQMLARPKGDCVMLRWAPDGFSPWYLANQYGYNIIRIEENVRVDTLKKNLYPMSLEEMKLRFEPSDSLAGAAAQMLYGKGSDLNSKIGEDGADGILQVYEEQQTRFAYAMLLSEIRPDIAKAMALFYVDSTAVKGKEYTYLVKTNVPDSVAKIMPGYVRVENVKQKPEPFEPMILDSLGVDGRSMRLFWPMDVAFTVYDIECRYNGGEWKKLNERPFMTLRTYEDESVAQNIFEHAGIEPGTYEYRICGYDSFGEKSQYSKVHRVEMPDIIPPTAPMIKYFRLERPDEKTVIADMVWEKNIKEPDFVGYDIYYYNPQIDSTWVKLNDRLLAPSDTIFRCEVTYLGTGRVTIMSVDTLGNTSAAMPQEMFIADFTAPAPPTELEYVMSPTGSVLIKWKASKDKDVAGYQLYYANDTTHTFVQKAGRSTRGTVMFDTLKVSGVAQRYTYYRLKAYDYSGNESKFSQTLQVKRKNYDAPRPCRIDSMWQDTKSVYMSWYPSSEYDVAKFYVYRRLEGEEISSLIGVLPIDSVKNGRLYVTDSPEPNHTKRYYYHIETMNETGITSEPSLEAGFLQRGEMLLPLTVGMGAVYRPEEKHVQIAWDLTGLTDELLDEGLYFCIYKKWDGEDFFRHIDSPRIDVRSATDRYMEPGDAAEYRIRVRSRDGRFSRYSNVVRVEIPEEKEEQK